MQRIALAGFDLCKRTKKEKDGNQKNVAEYSALLTEKAPVPSEMNFAGAFSLRGQTPYGIVSAL